MRCSNRFLGVALVALVMIGLWGCHADPDDPAGQAKELSDPLRRSNAIANIHRLYTSALSRAKGNRSAAEPKAIADATIQALTDCYVQNRLLDVSNAGQIMNLLFEMRDARSLPALLAGLDWKAEVSEEHAVTAAKTLREVPLDEAQKGQVIEALGKALSRVTGKRGVDNRMRIEIIKTLGALRDRRATPILVEAMLKESENQHFLINRLAAEQLGLIADPASVDALIKALYFFDPNNPQMRMNDVAPQALVRIGRPALEPLLRTLEGKNEDANRIASNYIEAIRKRDPQAAAQLRPEAIVASEASYALGQLGFREAIDALIRETNQLDPGEKPDSIEEDPSDEMRMISAAAALASIHRAPEDTKRIREALIQVFNRVKVPTRPQVLVIMQHLIDPELIPFFVQKAQRPGRGQEEDPFIRVHAFQAAILLANGDEAVPLKRLFEAEPQGDTRDGMLELSDLFAPIQECNADLACWIKKLSDSEPVVVRKACHMIARYGVNNEEAIKALIEKLGHPKAEVRTEVLYALDFVATKGSDEAVKRIEELKRTEEGRAIWNQVSRLALAVQARLVARKSS
ncbi:MAG: HEAT repeat domain-containing protein [Deltaproteobacteria bacterium]|nr:HEAT repeat domain-containing protein [Deltaproteobacteria bacterium]